MLLAAPLATDTARAARDAAEVVAVAAATIAAARAVDDLSASPSCPVLAREPRTETHPEATSCTRFCTC